MSDKKKEGEAPAQVPAPKSEKKGYRLVNVDGLGKRVYVPQTGMEYNLDELHPDQVAQLIAVGWPHIEAV